MILETDMTDSNDSTLPGISIRTQETARKKEPSRAEGEELLKRLLAMAGEVDAGETDYESMRKRNDEHANQRLQLLRATSAAQSPLMNQKDLRPTWTFANMRQPDPAMREPLAKAQTFMDAVMTMNPSEDPAPNLLIIGYAHSGKSFLAGSVTHELLQKGKKVLFVNFSQLLFNILDSSASNDARTLFNDLQSSAYDVAVLDDVVIHRALSEFGSERLSQILRSRLAANVSSVVVATCRPEQLSKKLGDYSTGSLIDLQPIMIDLKDASYISSIDGLDFSNGKRAPSGSIAATRDDDQETGADVQDNAGTEEGPGSMADIPCPEDDPARYPETYAGTASYDLDRNGPGGEAEEAEKLDPSLPGSMALEDMQAAYIENSADTDFAGNGSI